MNCQSIFRNAATLFLAAVLTSFTTGCDKARTPEEERVPEPGDVPAPTVTFDGKTIYFDEATETFSTIYPTRTDFSAVLVKLGTEAGRVQLDGKEVDPKGFTADLSQPKTLRLISGWTYHDFTLAATNTGLPVVRIQTLGPINSKEVWQEGASLRIELPDGTVDYEGTMSIRGRGNSTWGYLKKPYAIKLDEKAEILSMPSHKRWVLLANWKDRTLMRNDAAFWLSRHSGLPYTVRGQYVEVVLNGKHAGNYYLCEQIKINKNRVNVADGGLLLELDTYFDEVNRFWSEDFRLPWMVKEPDEEELTPEAFAEFKQWIADLEKLLKDPERVQAHEYEQYIDVDSAIDFLLVQELTGNNDFFNYWPDVGPHSVYLYKQPGGKLYTGPLWDFDFHTFIPDRTNFWAGAKQTMYYPALLQDEKFRARLVERWDAQKDTFKQLADYIDGTAERIRVSEGYNQSLWPITNRENGDEEMTFQEAVDRMRQAFLDKWEWMDKNIKNLK